MHMQVKDQSLLQILWPVKLSRFPLEFLPEIWVSDVYKLLGSLSQGLTLETGYPIFSYDMVSQVALYGDHCTLGQKGHNA